MKHFILLLALLLPLTSFAASSGSGNVSSVANYGGGVNGSSPGKTVPSSAQASTFSLIMAANPTTGNRYHKLVALKAQSVSGEQYQVPVGKTLVCSGFYSELSGAGMWSFGYGSAALIANDTATAPTGDKMYSAAPGNGLYGTFSTSTTLITWVPIPCSVPSI